MGGMGNGHENRYGRGDCSGYIVWELPGILGIIP